LTTARAADWLQAATATAACNMQHVSPLLMPLPECRAINSRSFGEATEQLRRNGDIRNLVGCWVLSWGCCGGCRFECDDNTANARQNKTAGRREDQDKFQAKQTELKFSLL